METRRLVTIRPTLLAAAAFSLASVVLAHCDTMDGPVVAAAKTALAGGDVTPVLKWVRPEDEAEIRAAFARAVEVRATGQFARELADLWFFETLVRVHRAGEGEPYTGLKPAGTPIEPSIILADGALATGDPSELVRVVTSHVAQGILERFARAANAKKHAEESVARGREFVAAYVELTHYVERLDTDVGPVGAPGAHGAKKGDAAQEHRH